MISKTANRIMANIPRAAFYTAGVAGLPMYEGYQGDASVGSAVGDIAGFAVGDYAGTRMANELFGTPRANESARQMLKRYARNPIKGVGRLAALTVPTIVASSVLGSIGNRIFPKYFNKDTRGFQNAPRQQFYPQAFQNFNNQ